MSDSSGPVLIVSPHWDDWFISVAVEIWSSPQTVILITTSPSPQQENWRKAVFHLLSNYAPSGPSEIAALGAKRLHPPYWSFVRNRLKTGQITVDVVLEKFNKMVDSQADLLASEFRRWKPSFVLAPYGIIHPDHVACHYAVKKALESSPVENVLYYLDRPYLDQLMEFRSGKDIPDFLMWRMELIDMLFLDHHHRIAFDPARSGMSLLGWEETNEVVSMGESQKSFKLPPRTLGDMMLIQSA